MESSLKSLGHTISSSVNLMGRAGAIFEVVCADGADYPEPCSILANRRIKRKGKSVKTLDIPEGKGRHWVLNDDFRVCVDIITLHEIQAGNCPRCLAR